MTRLTFYRRLSIVSGLVLVLLNHFAFGFLGFFIPVAKADAITWVGPSTGYWDNPTNWSSGTIPTASDEVIISGDDMFILATSTINFASLTLAGPDVRFSLLGGIGTGGDLTISESLFIQSTSTRQTISGTLTINDGVMQHLQNTSTTLYKLDFVAENIVIEPGGHVRVDNEGSPGGEIGEDGYGNGGGDGDSNISAGAGGSNAGTGGSSSSGNYGGFSTCTFSDVGPSYGGSGGGGSATSTGGDGGGFVRLEANNTFTINGRITADADHTSGQTAGEGAGGGSGGTIYLVADTISGVPEAPISARGGNSFDANGGAGGGGCVRLQYTTTSTIDGANIIVDGGVGFENGGAGVALVEKEDQSIRKMYVTATTTLNYGVGQLYSTAGTNFISLSGAEELTTLSVSTSSVYIIGDFLGASELTLTGATPFQGSSPSGTVRIQGDVKLKLSSGASIEDVTLELYHEDVSRRARLVDRATDESATLDIVIGDQGTLLLNNFNSTTPLMVETFTVAAGGVVTHEQNSISPEQREMVNIQAENITIESGGSINVAGKGYSGGRGLGGSGDGLGGGAYTSNVGVGAGHGGDGTANNLDGSSAGAGGTSYCDVSNPSTIGSGGSSGLFSGSLGRRGGNGGGMVWLVATNTITLAGDIFADGENGSFDSYAGEETFESISGAGSGGSVKLFAPTIGGAGEIFVRGGNNGVDPSPAPSEYGGGGGGCVLINYTYDNSVVTSSIYITGGGLDAGVAEDGQLSIVEENEVPELFLNFHKPEFVARVTSTIIDGAGDLAVSGDYAYVGGLMGSSFAIINISSTTNPAVVGTIETTSDLAGIYGVEVSGNYAYVVNSFDNSFRVIDISSSTNPTIVAGIEFDTPIPELMSIAVLGNYAYVIVGEDGYSSLRVINISNPLSPTVVGSIINDSDLDFLSDIVVSGSYAYVSTLAAQFSIINISNPSSPAVVGSVHDTTILDNSFGVAVSGNYAYVTSDDNSSVAVIDISDPENPDIVKVVTGGESIVDSLRMIVIEGDYAYVGMISPNPGIGIIDITNPLTANFVGYILDPDLLTTPARMQVAEGVVYMTDFSEDSLNIFNVSLPYSVNPIVPFDISDGDRETLSVKAEFVPGSCAYSGTTYATFVTSTATSTYGVAIDNSAVDNRRIKDIIIDPVSDFPITQVTTTWHTSVDIPGDEGEYCMFMTPYDGEDEGIRVAGTLFVDDPLLAPNAPSLSATKTQTSITLSWPVANGANHYVIVSSISGIPTETDETSVTYAGLVAGNEYTFQVKSVDNYGNESAYSEVFPVTTVALGSSPQPSAPPPPSDTTPSSTTTSTVSNPSSLIVINSGAYYTKSREVNVLFNTDFTSAYMLADTFDFSGKIYKPIVSSTTYILTPGDGEKRIYARFSNNYGIYDAYDVIVLDTVPPSQPTINAISSPDFVLKTEGVYGRKNTSSTVRIKPTLGGTAEPGKRIMITVSYGGTNMVMMMLAAVETYYTTADSNGNWSFTFPNELQNTYYTISVQTQDEAENNSSAVEIELDLRSLETLPCTINCEPLDEPPLEEPPEDLLPVEEPLDELPPIETAEEIPSCTIDCGGEESSPVDTGGESSGTEEENTTDATSGGDTEGNVDNNSNEPMGEQVISSITDSVSIISDTIETFFTEVGNLLQEIPMVRGIVETASVAVEKTREVIDNPTIEKSNEVIAAPIIAVAAAANVAVGGAGLLSQAMLYLRLIFSQPLLLLKLRKRKRWGVVFNAYTKLPLDLATVRLVNGKSDSIIRTQVTDAKGRYFMVAENGVYRLEAKKDGFGTNVNVTTEDSAFPNVYHGEELELAEESNNLNYNIPLEPIVEEKSNTHVLREYARKATHKTVSLIGAVATIVSLIISPKPWITALLVFHIVLYSLMRRLAHKKIKGTFGLVTDKKTGKEISKVVIRVFDAAYNKLVETGVTDSKGRYAILVGPSIYYITAEKEGFITYQSPTIDFSSEKTDGLGGVISESCSLKPIDFHEKNGDTL